MLRAKNISAFGQLENGNRKNVSLNLPPGTDAGVGLKHHNTVTGANFAAVKRRNKVGQISNSTRERWRQTTRNIKVRHQARLISIKSICTYLNGHHLQLYII